MLRGMIIEYFVPIKPDVADFNHRYGESFVSPLMSAVVDGVTLKEVLVVVNRDALLEYERLGNSYCQLTQCWR